MKKLTLSILLAFAGTMMLNAQTKQGVNAMKMVSPSTMQAQSASYSQGPVLSTQAISGYYQQGFEAVTFPPAGCRVENVAGPTYTWARSTAQAHLSTASAFIRYDAAAGGGLDWMMMPRFQVTAITDSIVFWMRLAFVGYQPDSLCIKVSTTDSLSTSFTTTLLKLREGTNYPANTTTWYRYAVSLQAYNGQQIYLAFKHYNVDGDGLYVDDISIGTPPAADITTTAMISPTATVGTGSIVPQGTFKNVGTATQTFNVTTTINPGGYTATTSVGPLAPNATTNASFAPWIATGGTYTVKMFSDLVGDANRGNDTLTLIVTVVPGFQEFGWDVMTAMPSGRWATGPVFAKQCVSSTDTGFIYLISGADAAFANSTLNLRYNTVTGVYSTMAAIPSSRLQITPVHINGKIYVIGGYSAGFTADNANQIYDIATNTWSTGAVMPTAVGDYAAASYNDSLIYYVCGYSGVDQNLVQIYNTYTNTWATGTPKTGAAVAGCRMGISGNKIVFTGGYSQTLAATQSAALLGTINPATPNVITWTSLPNYPAGPAGRHGAGTAFEDNGLVYFAGGDPNGQGTQAMNAVYAYNTIANQWEVGTNMPVGVSNINSLAGVLSNDSLYMVTMGGYNGAAVVASNHWLNIGDAAPLPTLQNDTSMCTGSSIMLNAYNGQSYSWSPAGSLNNATIATPTSTATATTTYTVTMSKGYGCPVVDQLVLTVNALPTVVANATASAVCDGSPVTLTGSGATSYTWDNSVMNNVAFTPTATTTYMVTGTDANGCMNTDNINIVVNPLPTVVANTTATAVCDGSPVTLSGSGATSYTWDNSVMDNVAFTPTATTTYMVTGTDGNGCQDMDMITITVNTLPTVVANASAPAVCDGSPVTLFGSGAASYTWDNSVMDNVAFTPVATNTYMVTGIDANGCQDMDMITITVNTLPTVVANATATLVCEGDSVTLTGSGASTYSWDNSVTDNVAFAAMATTTYMVTGTDANGCQNTDNIIVTVNAAPVVTGTATPNSSVCAGSQVTLTGSGATSYTWTGSVTDGVPFTPASTASYTVTGTDANGCTDSDEVTVTVNPLPTIALSAASSTVCLNDGAVALTGSPAGGTYSGLGVTGSSFTPMTAGLGAQTVSYIYTDANGCEATGTTIITVNACVGVAEMTFANSINVYPNPNNGAFTVSVNSTVENLTIEVLDMQGRVVYTSSVNDVTAGYSAQVALEGVTNGMYMVRLTGNGAQQVIKISVQN
ncbi:MAG: choice-of-anchor J domain-containing protein [Bacteroidota bacterium]|nr:choice-of-anchor J domain-containing protein [Bacteroidota bacterium]